MSTSEVLSYSTRVSSSAINKQGGSDYYNLLPIGTRQDNTYLYSCCGATCSSAQGRRSSSAYLGLRCGIGRKRCPALTEAWWSDSGPSRVVLLRLPLGALRHRTPWSMPDFWRDLSTISYSRQQMSIGYSALYDRSTTSEYRQLTFIHCSAWRIASK
jgi:hypothetical protein